MSSSNAPTFDMLSDVNSSRENWKLLVRIVRLWRAMDAETNKITFAIDMVITDAQGTKMTLTLKRQLFYKYEKELCEGVVYYMSNFTPKPNDGEYRSTNHAFKLKFKSGSVIKRADVNLVPPSVYVFTPPAEIFSPTFDPNYLVDVIGSLTGVGQQRSFMRNGEKCFMTVVDLDYHGYRYNVTLFGSLVDELQAFLIAGDSRNTVLAITFAKFKIFQGKPGLICTMHSSRLLLNPDVPEAVSLRNNMSDSWESPNSFLTQLQTPRASPVEDEFFNQTQPANIDQLKSCKQQGTFVVYATVNLIAGDGDWWYTACRCHKKVYPDEDLYFCDKCNKHVVNVTPRYLLRRAKLIIWDEAPMTHKHCFEAFDRTLRDIMSAENKENSKKHFGGKAIVLGGDFRQILPVVRKASREQIVASSINSSNLWSHCKVLRLTKNMRLGGSIIESIREEIKQFGEWILSIGDGNSTANELGESTVDIPPDLLITDQENHIQLLVDFTYRDILTNMQGHHFLEERGILAPTLESVTEVNDFMISQIPGEEVEYLSSDSVCKSDEETDIPNEWFTTEFLNEIKCSGIPNHIIKLKAGVPVMLMRNIDQSAGLCNGTRLMVNELGKNIIGATVLTGKNIGDKIFIPRMNMVPSDAGLPFKFRRRQFPISLCFAMTINKSQGQSLSHVGIYLPKPVFTHGQLYVALSRVKSRKGLKLLILDEEKNTSTSTKNGVYREVFENV